MYMPKSEHGNFSTLAPLPAGGGGRGSARLMYDRYVRIMKSRYVDTREYNHSYGLCHTQYQYCTVQITKRIRYEILWKIPHNRVDGLGLMVLPTCYCIV